MRQINAPLAGITRFGLGGPADVLLDCESAQDFIAAIQQVDGPHLVLGGGTNLLASDEGYRGTVIRYTGGEIVRVGNSILAHAGADLEAVVRFAIDHSLAGLESMMRIPGWVSGAVYGNAGAYGQSIGQCVSRVEIFDGRRRHWLSREDCGFAYRTSRFKQNKHWRILTAEFSLRPGDQQALAARGEEIRQIRDEKFPVTMKCAGSIFKNCILADLPQAAASRVPDRVVREGKVPSAWFLEQVGSKGMRRGGIHVADYHANLIYNAGGGTARDAVTLIDELKGRVSLEFGFEIEEEVQFVGFEDRISH
jgi:UDP-N-acetylmuramate dehydrogenase